ncbi:response regulator transcription factor [Microvirga sp. VF16]|uniref:LuxR C-terminal-related transcriptional regulator n=1 Tax=Microvirga sp. VF16 TaxID=2807101 RepID=UPI00193DBB59|nr:response regulator transcription factor [Microvirga sp. VF16]QRM35651.1 response regulator transcription factor [Microvirga sp. VF16]
MYLVDQNEAQGGGASHDSNGVATVIACKSSVFRAGLRQMLSGSRFLVLDEAFDGRSGLPSPPETMPVLAMVDADCYSATISEIVAQLKAQCPRARIAVLAERFEPASVQQAHSAGANGFLSTSVSAEVLVASLQLLILGETLFPADMVVAMMGSLEHNPKHQPSGQAATGRVQGPNPTSEFSNRELEILRGLRDGAPNKAIARKLDVAEVTVKLHVKALLKKIGAENRTRAAIWASEYLSQNDEDSTS